MKIDKRTKRAQLFIYDITWSNEEAGIINDDINLNLEGEDLEKAKEIDLNDFIRMTVGDIKSFKFEIDEYF
jgi:hypothetical protein